jgi:hypothetical protein
MCDFLDPLLADLPPSLRTLHLAAADFNDILAPSPSFVTRLVSVAPQLTAFHFTGGPWIDFPANAPGPLDGVVAELSAVERLTLEPHAVTDLAAALARLPRLVELELVQEEGDDSPYLDRQEVVELLHGAESLRVVSVGKAVGMDWLGGEREAVERAAADKDVKLVWA